MPYKKCPCGSYSNFNLPDQTKGVCCAKCKTPGMIDVVNKKCPCGRQPRFNVPEEKKGVCCSNCKTDEMIDVMSKRCPCGKKPSFNMPGETIGICCRMCKTVEMIDVVHRKCPCGKIPIFNIPGETKGVFCIACKTDGMINVVGKVCPGYNTECPVRTCVSRGNKYCMSCDPNDARRKRYKRLEEAFFSYINDKLVIQQREFRVSFDQSETSKKCARLDGVVFGDEVIVCIEVDENGHQEYKCEEHRMHLVTAELLQTYPDNIVSWVRVNPSVKSTKARNKRFDDVVVTVNDILKTRDTRVVYIGFD
jgi:hypothetical protein